MGSFVMKFLLVRKEALQELNYLKSHFNTAHSQRREMKFIIKNKNKMFERVESCMVSRHFSIK